VSTSVIVFAMLLPVLALAIVQSSCPLHVGVSNDGSLFFDRFQGWWRIDAPRLERELQQGCRTNTGSEPKPVTSVRVVLSPKAPKSKVDTVFSILEKNGWTREKVTVGPWNSYIRKVSGRFYIDKQTFPLNERVVLHFEVINSGEEPYWLDTTGLPEWPLCSGYVVKVFHQDMTPVTNAPWIHGDTCVNPQPRHIVIEPGAKYTQDIDLGLHLDLNSSGKYVVQAEHRSLRRNDDPKDPLDSKATFKLQLQ